MQRSLDFGLDRFVDVITYIRYRPDVAGFRLIRRKVELGVVDRLLLHIDFPGAEQDLSVGPHARGTGILQFSDHGPPWIADRDLSKAPSQQAIGFVLDVASPYRLPSLGIEGIGRQVLCSTFTGAKASFAHAYTQYIDATRSGYLGCPVFDVYGWETGRNVIEGNSLVMHKPRLVLAGFTHNIGVPLDDDELDEINQRRLLKMRERGHRPRLGVVATQGCEAT